MATVNLRKLVSGGTIISTLGPTVGLVGELPPSRTRLRKHLGKRVTAPVKAEEAPFGVPYRPAQALKPLEAAKLP